MQIPCLRRAGEETAIIVDRIAVVVRGAAQLLQRPERRHLRQLGPAGRRIAKSYPLELSPHGVDWLAGVNPTTLLQADPLGGLPGRQMADCSLP
jgi:hypothetical protein